MRPPRVTGRGLLVAAIPLVLLAAWLLSRSHREPRFEGRSATEWVQQLVRNQSAARRALLALGPGATPALARAVELKQRPHSSFLNSLRSKLPSPFRRLIPSSAETTIRGERAVEMLFDLGTNAAPAVPVLIREELRHDVWDLKVAHAALVRIGPAGAPQLARVLRSSDPRERVAAARYLGLAGPAAHAAAPALAGALEDPDPLVRSEAVAALIHMGPAARAALPELERSLERGDPDSRVHRIEAWWKMGGDSKLAAPLLTSILADRSSPHRAKAADLLGQMGQDAAPALPTLTNVLQEEFSYTRVKAQEALDMIERSLSSASQPTR